MSGAAALLIPLPRPSSAGLLRPSGGPSLSPDGSIIAGDTGGTLTSAYGTWGFGPAATPPTGSGDPNLHSKFYYVTLNGEIVAFDNVPSAQGIMTAFGGNVFFLTTQNDRWVFQMQAYNASAHLVGADIPTPPGSGVGPWFIDVGSVVSEPSLHYTPGATSPDGTTISGGSGTVTNRYGAWTFGSGSGNYPIQLNGVPLGVPPGGGNVTQIKIDKNGNIFALSTNTNWYAYLSYWWFQVGTSIPVGPIPTFVTVTPNLNQAITSSTPNGTVVASISVQTSDGSPFTGALSGVGPAFVGIVGTNVVVTSTPTVGAAAYEVTATQNGVGSFAGASSVDIVVSS